MPLTGNQWLICIGAASSILVVSEIWKLVQRGRAVMSIEDESFGPLQIVIVGFETTERFRGDAARELLDLRGRGMIQVLDARFFHRAPDGKLTEVDLGPLLADRPAERPTRSLGCSASTGAAVTADCGRSRRSPVRPVSRWRTCAGYRRDRPRRSCDRDSDRASLGGAAARGGARGGRQAGRSRLSDAGGRDGGRRRDPGAR